MATADKVSVFLCGVLLSVLSWFLLLFGWLIVDRNHKDGPAPWVDCPTHCVLVETPDGRLLWDTSCPRDWEERWAPTGLQDFFPYDKVSEDEYLDSRLKQMGLSPGDLDYVVFSHLHFDHAGNAQLFKDTNAKLVCSDKEHEWCNTFDGPFNGAHLKADFAGLSFETVSGDVTDFLPGVSFFQTPGHTPGAGAGRGGRPGTGAM